MNEKQLSIFDVEPPRVVVTCRVHKPRYNPEFIYKFRCGETVRIHTMFCSGVGSEIDKQTKAINYDFRMAVKQVQRIEKYRLERLMITK